MLLLRNSISSHIKTIRATPSSAAETCILPHSEACIQYVPIMLHVWVCAVVCVCNGHHI